jgi:GR25 family glycosyltransferase involved in LPS biosynthesis
MMNEILLLALVMCLALCCLSKKCKWNRKNDAPEVYWINMDKSKVRRANMEKHLNEVGFRHYRVRGLTPREIYIPHDVESTWRTAGCHLQTSWQPPAMSTIISNSSSEWSGYTSYTAALCGRGKKKNTAKELGCTTSHLMAMYRAIYSTTAKSRYAIIVEDDVQFPFDIDYNQLAASAPKGFGILQLFNSNAASMERTWKQFLSNREQLWIERHPVKVFDFWSTCAYLIDRIVMKSAINQVLTIQNGWWAYKVVAGIVSPCVPRRCCSPETPNLFNHAPPCVYAPQGYQADSFLYAMAQTLMLSVPVIANGLGGNQSTFHQDHVEMLHRKAFKQQRQFINQMLNGQMQSPSFMKPACDELLDVNLI